MPAPVTLRAARPVRALAAPLALAGLAAAGLAQAPPGYYDTVDETSAATLRATLHAVIDDHLRFPYTAGSTDTWDILESADEDPGDPGSVLDVYRNDSYPKQGGGNSLYNREHTWPNSYGFPDDDSSNYPYTDCHHLFLCTDTYNSARSNKPFRYCDASCDEWVTVANDGAGGGAGTYPGNSNWTSGSFTQGTWEVWGGRRGDVARAILYMDVRYEGGQHGVTLASEPDLVVTDDENLIDQSNTGDNESVAYMGVRSVLVQWHDEDPVDARELARNDVVFQFQGNRNPFVDHPEWVDLLFDPAGGAAGPVWINELHYENAGADTGEMVEIAGAAGTDLAGYRVLGYNGNGGGVYDSIPLFGTIPDEGSCVGAISYSFPGMQNGPDGLALVDPVDQVLHFVSYEGVITATGGPALGTTSQDVGVAESSATPVGSSLQLGGSGVAAPDFAWQPAQPATPAQENAGQSFGFACPGATTVYGCGVNPANSLTLISGTPTTGDTLTFGVDNPLGTQAPGSLPLAAVGFAPDPAFPCGTPIPGWGMSGPGASGELLVGLAPMPLLLPGAIWFGPGIPAPIALPLPADPALLGATLYVQGILADPVAAQGVGIGLTEAIEVLIGL